MELTHLDEKGHVRMVDVSSKEITTREAVATGRVLMKASTLEKITSGAMPKGDVLAVARIAGIMAAKRTQDLIPMCHNIPLDSVKVELVTDEQNCCVNITSITRCTWRTGVEMEALTSVSAAALALYDMCKAIDKSMVIGDIKLISKTGGKSGTYLRED